MRELARVARDLLVDLVTQLGTGASIDGNECDPCADQHHHRDPRHQSPAQPDPGQTPAQARGSRPSGGRRGSRSLSAIAEAVADLCTVKIGDRVIRAVLACAWR